MATVLATNPSDILSLLHQNPLRVFMKLKLAKYCFLHGHRNTYDVLSSHLP